MLYDAPAWISKWSLSSGSLTNFQIYGGTWSSVGLSSEEAGKFGDELDLFAGIRKKIGHFVFDVSGAYFILGDWDKSRDDRVIFDTQIDYVGLRVVEPYVAVRYFGTTSDAIRDGWFFWIGLKRKHHIATSPFAEREIFLNVNGSLAFATERSFGREGGFIFARIQTTLDIPLSKHISLCPTYMVQIPSGDQTGRTGDFTDGIHHIWGGFLSAKW